MPRLRGRLRTAATALLAVSGAAVLALAPSGERPPPPADFDVRPARSAPADPATPADTTDRAPTALPRRLDIDRVGLRADVEPVGVARDGSAEIPGNPDRVGWYRHGPVPGAPAGSAVLMGHVDSRTGELGAFARLVDVRPGDDATVRRASGPPVTYRVVARASVDKDRLPAEVFARTGEPVLTMITCAPPFDPDRGGYQRNLIVTATPVAAPR
ncbi:class F sortase [Streptomyces broussonetiae]|uniref:Class F sortase n=1 Tax=Streptomyces broussonetiae TaxID=2686304 RepID=A0ABV5EG09_9ACTN